MGEILDQLAQTTNLGEALEKSRVWELWPEIAGAEAAAHCRPQSIQEGRLRIEAESAVWMHKVVCLKWRIIRKVNHAAGKELIHDIFVTLLPDDESMRNEAPQA